ncbi:hypothetical protein NDU88_003069 [Pleurodeles waltl]|uniref:Uncharacterized protein n=1 Tax=Pleurodeles waltl TaxID=8319 RepID=A0AAV7UCB5_PLEWA|nr:hypothetical protein NDU88_003069 [Pleurodeles waltl]
MGNRRNGDTELKAFMKDCPCRTLNKERALELKQTTEEEIRTALSQLHTGSPWGLLDVSLVSKEETQDIEREGTPWGLLDVSPVSKEETQDIEREGDFRSEIV